MGNTNPNSSLRDSQTARLVADDDFVKRVSLMTRDAFMTRLKTDLCVATKGNWGSEKRKEIEMMRRTLFDKFIAKFASSEDFMALGKDILPTACPVVRKEATEIVSDIHKLCVALEEDEPTPSAKMIATFRIFDSNGQIHESLRRNGPSQDRDPRNSEDDETIANLKSAVEFLRSQMETFQNIALNLEDRVDKLKRENAELTNKLNNFNLSNLNVNVNSKGHQDSPMMRRVGRDKRKNQDGDVEELSQPSVTVSESGNSKKFCGGTPATGRFDGQRVMPTFTEILTNQGKSSSQPVAWT